LRFVKLGPVFAALVLAACESAPPPPPTVSLPPAASGLAHGLDLPTDASDVLSELNGFPIQFVARYYRAPESRWPTLTAGEVQRLSAMGLKIVTVWEWHSRDPAYFSYASGYYDALNAYRQARSVGQPAGSAIYFAVDFNARGPTMPPVEQYFRGVAAGLYAAGKGRPEYRVGVYGSGAVCATMKGSGLAQYAWLSGSTAWEGSAGYTGWNIRQAAQGARFANLTFAHDANEALPDYGGFQLAGYASAAAPPAAAPPAAAAQSVVAQQAPEPDRSTLMGVLKSLF
jgi:hypothetical protein